MLTSAFPRTQGALSRESYLTLLLLALVDQAGGELRISAQALEDIDSGGSILIDWDSPAQQCVIRAGTPALVIATARGIGWTTNATPQPSAPSPPDPSKHRVMTEDEIIKRMGDRVTADLMRQWREQGAAAISAMPPPDDKSA